MFTGVNIGKTLLVVDFDSAEAFQEEVDNMLVMASLLGYEIEYVCVTNSIFVNLKIDQKLLLSIQFVHDKSMILNCIEVCAVGEKFELMREKLKIKDGTLRSMKNYPKIIRKTKTLL